MTFFFLLSQRQTDRPRHRDRLSLGLSTAEINVYNTLLESLKNSKQHARARARAHTHTHTHTHMSSKYTHTHTHTHTHSLGVGVGGGGGLGQNITEFLDEIAAGRGLNSSPMSKLLHSSLLDL